MEIGITCGKPPILEIGGARHRKFYYAQAIAALIFHSQQSLVVLLQDLIVFILRIVLDYGHDSIRLNEASQVI